jgi:hypothetical protein
VGALTGALEINVGSTIIKVPTSTAGIFKRAFLFYKDYNTCKLKNQSSPALRVTGAYIKVILA